MLNDNAYNLMAQLVTESKSLYQIKTYYCGDAADKDECSQFWGKLIEDKEKHIKDLTALLQKELA